MKTARLTIVAALAGLFLLAGGSIAQAADPYPVATPSPTTSVSPDEDSLAPDTAVDPDSDSVSPDDTAVSPAVASDDNGVLPGTGGPAEMILVAGAALVVVGGVTVFASRRRHSTGH